MSLRLKLPLRGAVNTEPNGQQQPVETGTNQVKATAAPGRLPDPPMCRNYACKECSYTTSRSKYFLYHQREAHGETFNVVPCDLCEYASKSKGKTHRHRKGVHRDVEDIDLDQLEVVNEPRGIDPAYLGVKGTLRGRDENQNQMVINDSKRQKLEVAKPKEKKPVVEEEEVDEDLWEDEEFEEVDEEISFRSQDNSLLDENEVELESRSALGSDFKPNPTDNAYDYIMLAAEASASGAPLYQCRMCDHQSVQKWKVAAHIRTVHMKQTVFKCPFCDYVCRRKIEWCVHKTSHTNKVVYSCKECLYRTTMKRNFDRHRARHAAPGPVRCSVCTYSSTGEAAIQRHMAEYHHSPEKEKENRKLQESLLPGMNHNCPTCDVAFSSDTKLRLHLATAHTGGTYTCPQCSLSYKRLADLNRHMKKKHGQGLREYHSAGTEGSSANHTTTAAAHSASPAMDLSEDDDAYVEEEDGEEEVEEPLNLSIQQDEPLDLSTPRKDDKPAPPALSLECLSCAYVAKWPSDLQRHLASHSQQRPFSCQLCDATYKYQYDLNSHMRRSHDPPNLVDPDLRCPFCVYVATSTPEIEAHVKIHTGEDQDVVTMETDDIAQMSPVATERNRPFMCSECGRRSNWRWDLNKHIRQVHTSAHLVTLTPQEAKATIDDYKKRLDQQMALMHTLTPAEAPSETGGTSVEAPSRDSPAPEPATAGSAGEAEYLKQLVAEKRRPYKCSTCGKRSNWKWDVTKHIKTLHSGEGEVLVLREDEARAPEAVESAAAAASKQPSSSSARQPSQSHVDASKLKRFKCSLCPYRSNFRSDIGRHIKRKHRDSAARVAQLDPEEAAATLQEYHQVWARKKFVPTPASSTPDRSVKRRRLDSGQALGPLHSQENSDQHYSKEGSRGPETPQKGGNMVKVPMTIYKCSCCDFDHEDREIVTQHIQVHAVGSAHMCGECGDTFPEREALITHAMEEHHIQGATVLEDEEDEAAGQEAQVQEVIVEKEFPAEHVESVYHCKICGLRSVDRSLISQHAADKHSLTDEQDFLIEKMERRDFLPSPTSALLRCLHCPFTARCRGDLDTHLLFHLPGHLRSAGASYACPHCAFWASAPAQLDQHLALHDAGTETSDVQSDSDIYEFSSNEDSQCMPPPPVVTPVSKARHFCSLCPYVSANKNDFVYHQQFHVPKPCAPYKCDKCPYWVSLRRLLKQHTKVHTAEYRMRHRGNGARHPAPSAAPSSPPPSPAFSASPAKSVASNSSSLDEDMELAAIKQSIITSKVLSVAITPSKLFEQASCSSVGIGESGVVRALVVDADTADGGSCGLLAPADSMALRTMHTCRFCPYRNVRLTNLRQHEKMHGKWAENLVKCQFCDYHVGNAGVLARHVKVHAADYDPAQDDINDIEAGSPIQDLGDEAASDDSSEAAATSARDREIKAALAASDSERLREGTRLDARRLPHRSEFYVTPEAEPGSGGVVLERATFRRWCCERCPYATMKRGQLEKHLTLHAARHRYACEYCDYSVPAFHLLLQHKKLHCMPNPNLLNCQSVANLTKLPAVPADVALARHLPAGESEQNGFGIHDHLQLYENSVGGGEGEAEDPAALRSSRGGGSGEYLCDQCPYSSAGSRDELVQHMRCHVVRSTLTCPYCSYSVSKTHLLNQHLRIHFTGAGDELSPVSCQQADKECTKSGCRVVVHEVDARQVVQEDAEDEKAQEQDSKMDVDTVEEEDQQLHLKLSVGDDDEDDEGEGGVLKPDSSRRRSRNASSGGCGEDDDVGNLSGVMLIDDSEVPGGSGGGTLGFDPSESRKWLCQYCDRGFVSSDDLLRHENQHTIGSSPL